MPKGINTSRGDHFPWTSTTGKLPSLIYIDYVWDNAERDAWLRLPHWQRLDLLNARANTLDLETVTMPITLIFEVDNYSNVRIDEGLATITMTYNSSGYTYLAFTADMTAHMRSTSRGAAGTFWQAQKDMLTQFRMMSGPMVAAQLRSMYRQSRPETFYFLRTLIKEAIKGHREWVNNGGYTIAGDRGLGPGIARKFEAALQARVLSTRGGTRLEQLRYLTSQWSADKRVALQQYIDTMNDGLMTRLSQFLVFNERWLSLTQEEKSLVIELWTLEDENDRRDADNDEDESSSSDEDNGGGGGGGNGGHDGNDRDDGNNGGDGNDGRDDNDRGGGNEGSDDNGGGDGNNGGNGNRGSEDNRATGGFTITGGTIRRRLAPRTARRQAVGNLPGRSSEGSSGSRLRRLLDGGSRDEMDVD